MPEWIECELAQILLMTDNVNSPQVIVLREKEEAGRSFMVHIGLFEALAINRHVHGETVPRPLTHDLLVTLLDSLGGTLRRISISDLKEDAEGNGTFFGFLTVTKMDGTDAVVDCRPSDAIAMAVRAACPIFVAREVIDKVTMG
jgi:bifunctional DNase/RNase